MNIELWNIYEIKNRNVYSKEYKVMNISCFLFDKIKFSGVLIKPLRKSKSSESGVYCQQAVSLLTLQDRRSLKWGRGLWLVEVGGGRLIGSWCQATLRFPLNNRAFLSRIMAFPSFSICAGRGWTNKNQFTLLVLQSLCIKVEHSILKFSQENVTLLACAKKSLLGWFYCLSRLE